MNRNVLRIGAPALLLPLFLLVPGLCRAEPPGMKPPAPLPAEPAPVPAPAPAPAAPTGEDPRAPSGMVFVEISAAKPKIGTEAADVFKLAGKRAELLLQLSYETPMHDVALSPYFFDQFELTNAQYKAYLDQTAKASYKTGSSALGSLQEISSFFAYGDAKRAEEKGDKFGWGQLYELNRPALWAALPDLLKGPKGDPLPPLAAKEKFHFAALPPDVELVVYKARLPQLWFANAAELASDAGPNMPVMDVSYYEAQAYAIWAGKHIPTEMEWEWAARGPDARLYPWGSDWKEPSFDPATGKTTVESRCNWLDLGIVSPRTLAPATVEVDKMPQGASWCGAYHLLGNAAEWTSSWFETYPGYVTDPKGEKNRWDAYVGDYVKVIRGGNCADRERIVLRLPYRNFIGVERLAPPIPENHFGYVGLRCALYLQPGRDRLESAIAAVLKPKKVRREQIALERFGATAATHFAPKGTEVANHVHVTGKASTILLAPQASIFTDPKVSPRRRSAREILELTPDEDHPDAVVIGVFHTDVAITKVKLKDPKAPVDDKSGGRRGARKKAGELPATIDGDLPPDTYVLGLSHGRIGVYRSNLDFVAFLDVPSATDVEIKAGEKPPAATVTVEPDADLVKCSLWVAIGGKGVAEGKGVLFTWSMSSVTGQLEKAGNWR